MTERKSIVMKRIIAILAAIAAVMATLAVTAPADIATAQFDCETWLPYLADAQFEVCGRHVLPPTPEATVAPTATTAPAPTATTVPAPTATTPPAPTATPVPPSGRFETLPVGAALPSGAECAARVRPMPEVRPENAAANANRGSRANANNRTDWAPFDRVDGDFAGTTDEIIQWAACKWGIDEDIARAQVIKESYWYQSANGDNGESWGLGQVRDTAHQSAFEFSINARTSSAYNLDYTYGNWRGCFEGVYTWLNNVAHNGTYAAGDVWGCIGVWFSGRWYVNNDAYLNKPGDSVRYHYQNRTWEDFAPAPPTPVPQPTPTAIPIPTSTPVPQPTPTAIPIPTSTPVPQPTPTAITIPTSTPAPGVQFVETFDANTGMDRFRTGIYHRDNHLVAQTQWSGDHDLNCGPPSTQRTIHRNAPSESFYLCSNHMMTSVGDTSGYSIAYFSPDRTFDRISEVCWSVNLTNLGTRQWWKVAVLSVDAPDIMSDKSASNLSGLTGPDRAIVSWSGGIGWKGKMTIGTTTQQGVFFDAGSDKMTRYPACFRDNHNGTLTFTMTGPLNGGNVATRSYTRPGSFPSGPLKVVFQDHNYTPNKNEAGRVIGYTWHWDDIVVR